MRQLAIAFLLVTLGAPLGAQRLWMMDADSSLFNAQALIDLSASAGWQSNALERQMMDKLAFGGYIDRELIDRQSARIDDFLRASAGYDTQVRFWLMRDTLLANRPWAWQAQIENHRELSLAVHGDFYNLVFKGNKPDYLGADAQIGETWFDAVAFQKIGFGMVHKPTLSGFVVSLVNGQSFDRFYLTDGFVYTSESADSVAISATGTRYSSENSSASLGSGYGIGAALDAHFNLPLKEANGFVSVGVRNLGFVAWNQSSLTRRIDTVYTFTGVNIADAIADGQTALPEFTDSSLFARETGALTRWLPGYAWTRLMHEIGQRDFFEIEMIFRPVNAFVPQFSAGYHYRLRGRALIGATAVFGGFGGLRFHVSAEKWMGEHWFAAVDFGDVYGWASPGGQSTSAALRLTYVLKRNEAVPR